MRRWLFVLAAGALAVAGCRSGQKWKVSDGPPPERTFENTNFPHASHGGFDCDTCHDAASWKRLGDYVPPTVEKCSECHDADAAHTPRPAPKKSEYAFTFSHALHLTGPLKGRKDPCLVCHQALPQPGQKEKIVPPMAACTSCHKHETDVAEARCRPCHATLKEYGLKPLEQFTEFSHAPNFVNRGHGPLAQAQAETCAACHDQTYCAQCHATATQPLRPSIQFPENVTSNFIHRGNYVSRHHLDAERDPASCKKCHGSEFCNSCHTEHLQVPQSLERRSPHPAGWTARNAHGAAARQNIVTCSGCHDQGATAICVACHQPGGVGGNPHPAGWSSRHSLSDVSKNVACRACHR
jgi:hypothetical protein